MDLPLSWRCAMLFGVGLLVGMLLNWAVYNLAWQRRAISPWGRTPPGAAPRTWRDRLPVVGWFSMRREEALHGRRFWMRPLLVELLTGGMLAGLYWWEVDRAALVDALPVLLDPRDRLIDAPLVRVLHAQFVVHAALACLMLVASLIDFDEKTIPDAVTVTGALCGLVALAALPEARLPSHWASHPGQAAHVLALEPLHFAAPNDWPRGLGPAPQLRGLGLAWLCFALWAFALLDRRWLGRHGLAKGVRYFFARLARRRSTYEIAAIWLLGSVAIGVAWATLPDEPWSGLLTSLVGLAVGGGYVWTIRWISSQAMGREALGFGDVTLMAMIGAFLGWQTCLVVFLLAPLAGVVIAMLRWLAIGDREIYFGPFLCLAAAYTVLAWPSVWGRCWLVFELPWLVPSVLLAGAVLLFTMLKAIQWLKALV